MTSNLKPQYSRRTHTSGREIIMKKKITIVFGLWSLFFAQPLVAQDLGRHFQKIREGIYVYGIDDLPGRDPTSNCGIIITQEGVVLIDSGPNPPDSLIILSRAAANGPADSVFDQHGNS